MKREEERDKNQVKKANVAANWYLLQIVGGQDDSFDRRRSTTLAADEAEANARTDTTFKTEMVNSDKKIAFFFSF